MTSQKPGLAGTENSHPHPWVQSESTIPWLADPRRMITLAILMIVPMPSIAAGQSVTGESAKILAGDGVNGARLGSAIAVSGQQALIGAPHDIVNGVRSGSAYIYQLDAGVWRAHAKLTVADAGADADFGVSVAMHSDLAVVGAPGDDRAVTDAGSVFVYRDVDGAWNEHAKLSAVDAHSNQGFGMCLALDLDTIIVAAPGDTEFGAAAGAVYVFRMDGGEWAPKQKLVGSGVNANSQFGRSLSLHENTLAVGSAAAGGSVHVFEFDGGLWIETDVIPRPGTSTDLFATSVVCNGASIMVGAPQDSSAEFFGGAVYSYSFDGVDWVLDQQLLAFDPGRFDRFGTTLAVESNVMLVGAPFDAEGGSNSGSAYVYMHDGQIWTLQSKLLPSDIAPTDGFGSAMALGETLALVGSPADDDMGSASGSAYAFHGLRDCDDSGMLDLFEGDDSPEPCGDPGDVDGDGCAAISDLIEILRDFGRRCHKGHRMSADLDRNGRVDFHDLREFIREFGKGCHPDGGNGRGNGRGN
jgi:hypothetical protein